MTRYTEDQLKEMGFEIEDGWELTILGDWVGTSDEGTIDMTVEYLFHVEDAKDSLFEIDDNLYAISAHVLSVDSWNGEGPLPFGVGETFDTLDEVTFKDCKE